MIWVCTWWMCLWAPMGVGRVMWLWSGQELCGTVLHRASTLSPRSCLGSTHGISDPWTFPRFYKENHLLLSISTEERKGIPQTSRGKVRSGKCRKQPWLLEAWTKYKNQKVSSSAQGHDQDQGGKKTAKKSRPELGRGQHYYTWDQKGHNLLRLTPFKCPSKVIFLVTK